MANFYSDWFVGSGANSVLPAVPNIQKAGLGDSRLRWKRSVVTLTSGQDLASGDVLRLMPCKPTERPIELWLSGHANLGLTSTVDLGLYKAGANHDGVAVMQDLFMSAVDYAAGIARTDRWNEALHFAEDDRGKALFELTDIEGTTSYGSDPPNEEWEYALTFTANPGATAGAAPFQLDVIYVAGD
jgi:hypothetical protein